MQAEDKGNKANIKFIFNKKTTLFSLLITFLKDKDS
jgi:hypothetical protein